MTKLDYQTYLRNELDRRKKSNRRYSLRAFAKFLDLDPSYLSNVLTGSRMLSVGSAKKVIRALNLTDVEGKLLLESVSLGASKKSLDRHGIRIEKEVETLKEIDNDSYTAISDMLHYLIIEATFLDDFKPDTKWMARRFERTAVEVEDALARLIRLGLLARVNGAIKKTDRHIMTKDISKTTPALKASQSQILKSAMRALEKETIERRSATGMTMAIDPAKLPLAKKMITDFTNNICELLESGARKEIYQLSINLFSIEKNLSPKT
jgi:uncharacterized protein (TIGR02147 family)